MVTAVIDEIPRNTVSAARETVSVNPHGRVIGAVWPPPVETRQYLWEKERRHRIPVVMSVGTNGVLEQKQRTWLIENIDSATVPLDQLPEIRDSYRQLSDGGPTSDFVVQTVRRLDEADFSYGIRTTATARGVGRMAEITSYIPRNSCAQDIKIEPIFWRGRAGCADLHSPDAQEFVAHFRKARKVASALDPKLSYSGARLEVLTNTCCNACCDLCIVTADGDTTSCHEVSGPEDPLVEAFFFGRHDPLTRAHAVNEERRQRLHDFWPVNQSKHHSCFCKWHCAGDCAAKSLCAKMIHYRGLAGRCFVSWELIKDQLIAGVGINGIESQL